MRTNENYNPSSSAPDEQPELENGITLSTNEAYEGHEDSESEETRDIEMRTRGGRLIEASEAEDPEASEAEGSEASEAEGPLSIKELQAAAADAREQYEKVAGSENLADYREELSQLIDANKALLRARIEAATPSLDDFLPEKPGDYPYNPDEIAKDAAYVASRETLFDNLDEEASTAKYAEAIIAMALQQGDLFYLNAVDNVAQIPVTRLDDIANGIDQAATMIFKDGTTIPFAFDVTISHDPRNLDSKLFRGDIDSRHKETRSVGRSHLQYGEVFTKDAAGVIKDTRKQPIDAMPRFTLALSEQEVSDMCVAYECADEGDHFHEYSNISSDLSLRLATQIIDQCELYSAQTTLEIDELKREQRTANPARARYITRRINEAQQMLDYYKKISDAVKPAEQQAYRAALSEYIEENGGKPRFDDKHRQEILGTSYLGRSGTILNGRVDYYLGYEESFYADEEAYIQQKIDEYRQKRMSESKSFFEPDYTVTNIAEVEYEAIKEARARSITRGVRNITKRRNEGIQARADKKNARRGH